MKYIRSIVLLSVGLFFATGCDKDFKEVNTDPNAVTKLEEPGLLFTNILLSTSTGGGWTNESTIVQHFVLPYNLGATSGFQFNDNSQGVNSFGPYTGNIRTTVHIMQLIKNNPARSNLYNMCRIWKAYHFMRIVDSHGDVPYFEAVRAREDGIFYPKYDDDEVIYEDLYKELHEAIEALDPAKDNNSRFDIFVPSASSTAFEVAYWKKLGYSIMLRLGMRYTKIDEAKAEDIVREAFEGGVMETNADNAYIAYKTATGAPINGYSNNAHGGVRGTNPYTYYLAEPLIEHLKDTYDPRLKFISANYVPFQNQAPSIADPDTTRDAQFGVPIGYDQLSIASAPGYRGQVGEGQNYSQLNYNVVANTTTPAMIVTCAQTQLLLAEAAWRGYLDGLAGAKTAEEYYEAGITASIENYQIYPNVVDVPASEIETFLNRPGVAYDDGQALELINTQYWVECFTNSHEAWCNFRRSDFPALQPNLYNDNFDGGFVRRFTYLANEQTRNTVNYNAAVAAQGPDVVMTRVFWDAE